MKTIATLTPLQSKALAVSLLLLALAIASIAVAVPVLLMHRHYDEAKAAQLDRLQRYQRVANTRPQVQKLLDEVKGKASAQNFLKNTSPALAAAEIQEVAQTVIEAHGGKLTSMQINPHKDEAGYRQVSLNVQLTGTIAAIQKIFYDLEIARPYLFINNVSLRSPLSRFSRPTPGVEPEFTVQFDLTAYAIGGKS